jgi:predicted metal-dependent phosphoesterase TrpH
MCDAPGVGLICRESYNDPAEVYLRCKQRGMSIVTLTDHDSIDAAESLRSHPDFFLSEEVTCRLPSGTQMHLGVYGLNDRDHLEIQNRRNDFLSLVMYLTERKLFFSVNHIFSGLTGHRELEDFEWFASYVPAFEARNGQMCPQANHSAEILAHRLGKIAIAGSDSHTIAGVARTYTEVPRARTVEEFFGGLRTGHGRLHGAHGSYSKITADIFRITLDMFGEKYWTVVFAPLVALIPVFTVAHWCNELRFSRKWSKTLHDSPHKPRMLLELGPHWERI